MSQFQGAVPEPKKVFLDLLIKNADFLGQQIATGRYTEAVSQMMRIATDILYMANSKEKTQSLYKKLESWVFVNGSFTIRDVQIAHCELKEILQKDFFSELQIGIIPTSTLQKDKDVPTDKPMIATSSRL